MSKVAVIIPTYNDAIRLKKCIHALGEQSYPIENICVYVVDNNSTEDIRALVAEYPFCRYLHESKPGAYNARNTALTALQDETYVAFTDADCIPEPSWVSNAVAILQEDPCQVLGGKVKVFCESSAEPNLIEWYEILFAFPQQVYIEKNYFAVTANVFTSRQVVDKNGPFNADLFSGGDAEWGNRLRENNIPLCYAESVTVCHPARDSLNKIVSKVKRTVGGCYQQITFNPTMTQSFSLRGLARGFVPPVYAIRALYKTPNGLNRLKKLQMCGLLVYLKYHKNVIKILYRIKLIRDFERF